VPELFEGWAPVLGLWIGAKPQGDVSGLHSPPRYPHHVAAEGTKVRLFSQPGVEGLKRLCGVVLAAVEAPVYEALHPLDAAG
jgi:hypothetical protein